MSDEYREKLTEVCDKHIFQIIEYMVTRDNTKLVLPGFWDDFRQLDGENFFENEECIVTSLCKLYFLHNPENPHLRYYIDVRIEYIK